MSTDAAVVLWGSRIGGVSLDEDGEASVFQYDPDFARSGIQVAPFTMPLREAPYVFPGLARTSFLGLPGMLADSLPDRFGNALIDAWLAREGRDPASFNPVERLCYIGTRGMGALEYRPLLGPRSTQAQALHLERLVELASEVLTSREGFAASLAGGQETAAMREILLVGTSAGGARAKAVIAYNEETGEVRSGQVKAGPGFGYWLLKFDGVAGNRDRELEDPRGYCAIEHAYYRMASAAGIEMTECRLLAEGPRRHFMTRRFDRGPDGSKVHMQSLAALAHFDFNLAGAHSYEQAMLFIRRLGLGLDAIEQQYRRMVFNVVGRNHDDHVKNVAFLMDRGGRWSLSPAFDVSYNYNPQGAWTSHHQMSINGRVDDFTRQDLRDCARSAGMKRGRADAILLEVVDAVSRWREFAAEAQVPSPQVEAIESQQRLRLAA